MSAVPVYNLAIDLDDDGDWSDPNEDISADTIPGSVAWERGRDRISSIAGPLAGSLRAALDNSSGSYNPENTGSPIYPNFDTGRVARLSAVLSSTTYELFRGPIEEPEIDSEAQRVPLRAFGTLTRLARTKISTPVFQNYRTDEVIEAIVGYAGLNVTTYTDVDEGQTTIPYWWASETDALTLLVQILNAEGPGAAIFEDGQGRVVFRNRHHRILDSRSNTSQATISDTGTGALHVSPYRYGRGSDNVVNAVELVLKSLAVAGVATTLWEGPGEQVIIPVGGAWSFRIVLDDPALDCLILTHTSYAAGMTPTYSLTYPYSGTHFDVVYTNTDTVPLVIDSVELTGKATTSTESRVRNAFQPDAASTAKHGVRTLAGGFQPWPYLDLATAQGLADAIVVAYQYPRPQVEVTIENATAAEAALILTSEIGDRLTIVDSRSSVNGDFWIEKMAHRIEEETQWHRVVLSCEKVPGNLPGVYGTAVYGSSYYGF